MRNIAIVAALVLVGLGIAYFFTTQASQRPGSAASPYDTYLGLRNSALKAGRAKFGLPPTAAPNVPWGAVMDWGMDNGTATVVAYSDGSASVYLSSGGGFIGGKSHEAVRKAAEKMVAAAAECRQQTHATTTYPLPQQGEVFFYLLTDEGVFTASASEQELMGGHHPLSRLGGAAQNVITEYRRMRPQQR